MATPQVQTSVSECVLRNQSHFLKVLVSSCGSDRRGEDSDSEENSPVIDITDLWVHKPQYLEKTRRNDERNTSSEDSGINWDKVREIVVFSGKGKNAGENKSENSPSRSDASAAQVPNSGGFSSLVRRWRDFEVVANNNNNINSSISISRSNSTSSTLCDDSSIDGRLVQSSSGDGESDRTMPPLRDKDSDASERERLKVSDIIKKLTCNVIGGEENHSDHGGFESPSPRLRTPSDHHSPAVKSPRFIRGRHAFADLLMQMERERVREIEGLMERKTVSKFQHKGRIQAMFRLKLIRGPVDANDSRPLHFKASESNISKQSSIMNLRDRFNAVQQGVADSKTTSKEETIGSISPNRDVVDRTLVIGNVSTSCQVKEEKHPQQGVETSLSPQKKSAEPSTRHSGSSSVAGIQLDGCSNSKEINSAVYEVTGQNVSSGVGHNESIKSLEIARPLETGDTEERKENSQQVAGTSEWGWVNEYSHVRNGSDESQYDFREQEDASQDWIIDVSRPQSVWEDLRQARYQEMLDPFLDNHDIQELLERRSVSNFLYGGMREIIDRLMISRSQGHQRTIDTAVQEVKEQAAAADGGDRVEERRCIASGEGEYQEEENEEEVDNREEDNGDNDEYGCQIQQLNEPAGSVDQTWSYNQGRDLSDESDQTTSAYSQNNEPFRSPSQRHPSIEIQLIYELKTHMEQLHQEMFEIRRSLKSCVNMQMKLQRSIKHEVTAVLAQSGHKRGKGSGNKRLRKGYCCICQDTKVDSLLYRCGHICTCFNCARQLQSGDGKCPICQAPILDVVRTHTH
nr:putative E3 ubiquitin ligase [Ipomoea batatas]GMD97568.1 putative E3 ubiquitin ligase [Ipomoea batatas]